MIFSRCVSRIELIILKKIDDNYSMYINGVPTYWIIGFNTVTFGWFIIT